MAKTAAEWYDKYKPAPNITDEEREWLRINRAKFEVDQEGYYITTTGKRRSARTLLTLRDITPEERKLSPAGREAKYTVKWDAYLEAVGKGSRRTEAAKHAKIEYNSVMAKRKRDPEFAAAEKEALIKSTEPVVNALFEAALNGNVPAMTKILDQLDPEQWAPPNKHIVVEQKNQLEVNAGDIIDQIKGLMGRIAERRELTEGYIDAEVISETFNHVVPPPE